jgi:hypothetical protein
MIINFGPAFAGHNKNSLGSHKVIISHNPTEYLLYLRKCDINTRQHLRSVRANTKRPNMKLCVRKVCSKVKDLYPRHFFTGFGQFIIWLLITCSSKFTSMPLLLTMLVSFHFHTFLPGRIATYRPLSVLATDWHMSGVGEQGGSCTATIFFTIVSPIYFILLVLPCWFTIYL